MAIASAIPAANLWDILVTPLGWIFQACYWLIPNFVAAIFLFALFFKVVLFPLDIKRQKAQAKMARFQPRIAAIQKKYANDQARQNEELQKLYTEEGYNPAGGCLPSLLPLPIFFGLYAVIRRPLTYLVGMSAELLAEGEAVLENLGTAITNTYYIQLDMLRQFRLTPEAFSADFAAAIGDFKMTLFGVDLTGYIGMEEQSWVYWLFPIFTVVTQIMSSYVIGRFTQKNNEGMPGANAAMNPFMLFGMPLLTGVITYKFPAGVMLYWIFNSLLMMVSNIILNTCWPIKKLAAKYEEEAKRNPKKGKTSKFREKLMAAQKNNAELEKQYLEQADLSNRRKKELERRLIANAREVNQTQVEVQDIPNPVEERATSFDAPSKEAREAYLRMLESQKKKKR